jgi:hypothetical protein
MEVSQGFVDESGRGGDDYYLCAAVILDRDVDAVRKLARSFLLSGQRTVHFVRESDSRRGKFLTEIVSSALVRARVYAGKGDANAVRDAAMREMAADFIAGDTRRLTIESRQGRDHRDRHALAEVLRALNKDLVYDHCAAPQDPALWIADAVAWSYSAGGTWRTRLRPILDCEHFVGAL